MNYFAHGREFVDEPYFLAGTAVPDWLSVVDRPTRIRSRQALEHVDPTIHAWPGSRAALPGTSSTTAGFMPPGPSPSCRWS